MLRIFGLLNICIFIKFILILYTKIKEYNEKVKRFTLPDFGSDNTLAVVFGSTKTFWPNFVKYIKSVEEIPNNPVDTYFQHIIEEVIFKEEPFTNYEYEVRYEWSSPRSGKFVHVQTAGHLAGIYYLVVKKTIK